MFKIGQKVKVIDDDISGVVTRTKADCVYFNDEFGFEYEYNNSELIKDIEIDYDEFKDIEVKEITKAVFKTFRKSHRHPYVTREIDLHIENLTDDWKTMDNSEILQLQIDVARNEIERAMLENQIRLILIHGYGKGILRKELTELLYRYTNIEFYDASLKEYHGDAIEVKYL
ncbi:Smr/MutS family protein [Faecalibacter rhinopitheci]|uniref:Smr/MutS family protein n=1 Tax=Faecalibacter rhinopitheci TaxID=2779678 RepID=A0A8J7G655_9FLAO|nr:Smr/MutS family protein [Faecalibacter rhinopitheci]MBF0597467.1 Smr/MutS family protein [Faecalibacter rhinopitheci]MBQ0147496.1 Smr/MutS family protein [Candidatus Onthonaster equi]